MITAEAARDAAAAALAGVAAEDSLRRGAGTVSAGEPLMVQDLGGRPAYWLVPLLAGGTEVGAARVGPAGRVMTIGLARRAGPVTGLTAGEAAARVRAAVPLEPGEAAAAPRFVHDGPPGREAWLVETRTDGRPLRWIFVTPGGIHQRVAGTPQGGGPDME